MSWSWKKQLEVGQNGEHMLIQHYHEPLIVAHNLKWDFVQLSDGAKVEVKTDTYDMNSTPNFFMERWGNEADKKPGGPWRARKHSVDHFVYFFVANRTYFVFTDVKELCARADKIAKRKSTREIKVKNKGYLTVGYPMPRDEFEDLYDIYEF